MSVRIHSQCKLQNKKGTWAIAKTPGTAKVAKAKSPLNITCASADGYKGAVKIESSIAAVTGGNILLGGVIGAGVDAGTGAAFKYPSQVIVPVARVQ